MNIEKSDVAVFMIPTQNLVDFLEETCLCVAERRKLVAAGLWQTGFHTAWMYQEDKGSFSSRDLLLALGWLLAAGTLEKLLTQRVQQLDKTLLSSLPVGLNGCATINARADP